jgi:pilus assembly protein Flp/PilA
MTGARRFAALRRFGASESGATAIEYGIIAAFIFLVIVTPLQLFGPALTAIFERVAAGFP